MRLDDFRGDLGWWMRQNPGALFELIPEASGIIRLVNVPHPRYDPTFVSRRPGRWTLGDQAFRYFANDLVVCAAELGFYTDPIPPDRVVELWQTTRPIKSVSVTPLPRDLRDALYEDRGDPAIKWQKPHALLEALQADPDYRDNPFIYAPSASGLALNLGGMSFVAPDCDAVERVAAMRYREWQDL
jgi:hypothetical protein